MLLVWGGSGGSPWCVQTAPGAVKDWTPPCAARRPLNKGNRLSNFNRISSAAAGRS
ncbi:hypothetical protein AQPW35_02650 [Rubrivivax pictus]|uniref:Uncharacterized protein n=1 Tax=Pseudaquabacterium pictum TaxID=2315236 RepID=A0A480AHR8_9BURK|nr:hypothetical protein AQPW35_02650 [Rubrivivax pictus]